MHSFTSSSNDRLPLFDWRKIGAATALSVIAFLGVWNALWISVGFPLEPRDNAELWNYHRRRATRAGASALVFIGTSRTKAGIDLDEARRQTGKIPIQLAIAGKSPLPSLKNLAEDEAFKGTVVMEATEYTLYTQRAGDEKDLMSDYEAHASSGDYIFPLKSFAQSLIASPNLGTGTSEVLTNIVTGKVFDKEFLKQSVALRPPTTAFNRSSQGYADDASPEQIEQRRQFSLRSIRHVIAEGAPDAAKFADTARQIDDYASRIRARGGRVVLVNFPLNGEVKELNERYFPKTDYWHALASLSSVESVHYAEHPTLAAIETLDGTHFSGQNATLFTRELFKVIDRRSR